MLSLSQLILQGLHIGHLRGAILGDVLAKLLTKTGFRVTKEYYVNDLGVKLITWLLQ